MSDCLFCSIVAGEIPCDKVYEDENFIAFRDINPQAPVHILVIPRRHVASTVGLDPVDAEMIGGLAVVASRIASSENLDDGGYRWVINCGADGGQSVAHLHLHLLGGRALGWPPG